LRSIIARKHSVKLVKYSNSVRYFETVALMYSRGTTTKVMVGKYDLFTAHNAFFILHEATSLFKSKSHGKILGGSFTCKPFCYKNSVSQRFANKTKGTISTQRIFQSFQTKLISERAVSESCTNIKTVLTYRRNLLQTNAFEMGKCFDLLLNIPQMTTLIEISSEAP